MKELLTTLFGSKAGGFWEDSKLENIQIKDEYKGANIAASKWKEEREQMCKDLVKELDANLNPKSW